MSASEPRQVLTPVPFDEVVVDDDFWAPRMAKNRETTLDIEYQQMQQTGRIDAFNLDWRPGMEPRPHQFWDSDVAKWIEAAGYSLATHPDPELAARVDAVIDKVVSAQQDDGYLNVYFTVVEPQKRWQNLRDMHELYCAGHMMEAAVAHFRATGKRKLLDAMCRYADYIDSVFGDEEDKRPGTPGHEEIELALVKLYEVTGEERYLKLSEFFLNQRGRTPSVFQLERPDEPYEAAPGYHQDHLPVREQTTAEGHSVRAMYLYSAMADVAGKLSDTDLLRACERLWDNTTLKRMYVTGGIGSTREGERFTRDYDLPNETAYAETCAAIGLVFFATRMVQLTGDGKYADVMELALYNGTISGVSLNGSGFFYVNPLESAGGHHRQDWFGCACCPPNIARLIASLGGYIYSRADDAAYVHLYVQGQAELEVAGHKVVLKQQTRYPWEDTVALSVRPDRPVTFSLRLRVPGWCSVAQLSVDGRPVPMPHVEKGYIHIDREWTGEETVELVMPMRVQRLEAHPKVKADAGCVALQRGPVIFCLEQIDNGVDLHQMLLPRDAHLSAEFRPDMLGGVVTLTGDALVADESDWQGILYRPEAARLRPATLTAVPYCVWDNREPGQMRVWIRSS